MLDELKDQVNEGLRQVIVRALEPDPANRFADMDQIIGILPRAPAAHTKRPESMSAIAQSTSVAALRPWAVGALLAAITTIAGVIFWLERSLPSTSVANSVSTKSPEWLREAAKGYAELLAPQAGAKTASGWFVRHGSPVAFWYRSNNDSLEPMNALRGVSLLDPAPALNVSTVGLESNGRVLEIYRAPTNPEVADWASETTHTSILEEAIATAFGIRDSSIVTLQPLGSSPEIAGKPLSGNGWSAPIPIPRGAKWYTLDIKGESPLEAAIIGNHIIYLGSIRDPLPRAGQSGPGGAELHPIQSESVPQWVRDTDAMTFDLRSWLQRVIQPAHAIWWLYVDFRRLGPIARTAKRSRATMRHEDRAACCRQCVLVEPVGLGVAGATESSGVRRVRSMERGHRRGALLRGRRLDLLCRRRSLRSPDLETMHDRIRTAHNRWSPRLVS